MNYILFSLKACGHVHVCVWVMGGWKCIWVYLMKRETLGGICDLQCNRICVFLKVHLHTYTVYYAVYYCVLYVYYRLGWNTRNPPKYTPLEKHASDTQTQPKRQRRSHEGKMFRNVSQNHKLCSSQIFMFFKQIRNNSVSTNALRCFICQR